MTDAGMEGLRTDQAPPLSIPAGFFLISPSAMIAAGTLIALGGGSAFGSRWLPAAMAATHLGTLGIVGAVMLGALYQMIPVVAGAPVPLVRLAHGVNAAFAVGLAALAAAFLGGSPTLFTVAAVVLGGALLGFVVPTAVALARAPSRGTTVTGIRIAVGGLVLVATLGIDMALTRAGLSAIHGDSIAWVSAHAALGGLVWIGGLVASVSWQVVPMFYLAPDVPRWTQRASLVAVALALVAAPVLAVASYGPEWVALAVAPAAAMIWIVHPLVTARALRSRKRRRVDGSVRFWWAGLACTPLAVPLAAGTLWGTDGRWSVGLGFLVVWGSAGLIVHGMLTRIVPFLVWFHRYSALVGTVPVPSMRALLPDGRIRIALAIHVAALVTGGAAIATGWPPVGIATGVLVAATGVALGLNLIHALRQRPR